MERDLAAHPELICGSAPNEWSIALDGRRALTFSGPGARDAAEKHCAELEALVITVRFGPQERDDDRHLQ
jgi:hypothetical protein